MDQNNQQEELNLLVTIGSQLDLYVEEREFQRILIPNYITLADSLPFGYTNKQFIGCLLKLINEMTKDQVEFIRSKITESINFKFSFEQQFKKYIDLIDFKNGMKHQEQRIQEIDCKISIFESMFLKIFQSKDPKVYMETLNSIFIDYIKSGYEIQERDMNLIQRIVNSTKVKPLIRRLNEIHQIGQTEAHLDQEINQLLKVLSQPFCISQYPYIYGLTCFDGKLVFRSQLINYRKQGEQADKYRALLIITCIHEVFFHLKRITYCHVDDVLKSTLPKYYGGENDSDNQLASGEAGNYFEYKVFKNIVQIRNCSQELAEAILNPDKWEDDNFKFWNIQIKDSPNLQRHSHLFKENSEDMSSQSPREITHFKCLSGLWAGSQVRQQTK